MTTRRVAVMSAIGYTTWGSVRGMGPLRADLAAAERDYYGDQSACERQGGYSDREVVSIDADGILYRLDGSIVWPSHGRTSGAVRVDPDAVPEVREVTGPDDE